MERSTSSLIEERGAKLVRGKNKDGAIWKTWKREGATSQQVRRRFQSPPSVTAAVGSDELPGSVLVRVLPLTPTSFSVGGLNRSFLSKLRLQRGKLYDENRRVRWRALEWFWQYLATLIKLCSSLASFFFFFNIFHSCKGSPIKGCQSITKAVRQKLGKLYKLFFYIYIYFIHQFHHFSPTSTQTLSLAILPTHSFIKKTPMLWS